MYQMQTFHDHLFGVTQSDDPYLQRLARLTQALPGQLTALKSTFSWDQWPAEVIERSASI